VKSRAVRAQVGASQEGLDKAPLDFFVTHPSSVETLLRVEKFPGVVWEPVCGDGTMARTLELGDGVARVAASDVADRGFGFRRDFLKTTMLFGGVNHIVTNPPFELADQFVRHALRLGPPGKVAMFLRLAFLEGSRRGETIFRTHPPSRVWVFSRRQALRRNGGEWQSGLIAFAWYVWDRGSSGPTTLGWL